MSEHFQIVLTIIGVVAGLISAWSIIILTVGRIVLKKCIAGVETKISTLSGASEECKRLEKEILMLKADLPVSYVRREDFIRFDTLINVKLDRLRDLLDNMDRNIDAKIGKVFEKLSGEIEKIREKKHE